MLKHVVAIIVLMSASSAFAEPTSFLEAVDIAIKNNPETVSTNEFLDSIYLATQGVKAAALPGGAISCSINKSVTDTNLRDVPSEHSQSFGKSCGISAFYVVYDGGAQKYRYLSAKAGADALSALYNTSDSLTTNTRGGLANNTKTAYENLVAHRSRLLFYKKMLDRFIIFKKVSTDNTLLSRIVNVEQFLITLQADYDSFYRDFAFYVTVPPSLDIDDLETTLTKIKIPETVDQAIALAIERGPEVVRRNFNVTMAEFNVKAQKATMGPVITLNGSVDHGSFQNRLRNTYEGTYTSKNVGLTLTIPLSPSSSYYLKSAEKELAAQRSQRAAALNKAEHTLRNTYKDLETQQKIYASMKNNLAEQEAYMQSLVDRIEAGDTKDMDITKMLSSMGTLEGRFENLTQMQHNIFRNLYSVQQVTGILLEQF